MRAVAAVPGATGVDCVTVLDAAHAVALREAGVYFAGRYLGHTTAAELTCILNAGLQCTFVAGYSRMPGWVPTQEEGAADGAFAVAKAQDLALPPVTTIWLDLETWIGGDPVAWVNAAAGAIQAASFEAGLYVGYNDAPLSPLALYHLAVTRYWKSCSRVPTPATRGFCMIQSDPNVLVAGVQVDRNVVQADALGCVPTFVAAD